MGRGALYRDGLSAGLLSALSRIPEVLSAVGAGALQKFAKYQLEDGRSRNVSVGASGAVAGGRPLLIVTGLYSEARIAAGAGMTVICSSSDPDQLRAQLDTFDHASVRGIISFGIAGGLDPSLQAGDLVVANEIMTADARWATRRDAERKPGGRHEHRPAQDRRRHDRRRRRDHPPSARQGPVAQGHGRDGRRYGKPHRRGLCRLGRPALRSAARDQRSRVALTCRRWR